MTTTPFRITTPYVWRRFILLFLGCTAVASSTGDRICQALKLAATLVTVVLNKLSEVRRELITNHSQLHILGRQSRRVVGGPADVSRVVDLVGR